jgi:redox-sensitive bicupin YhaK (pirin superfamily)
VKVHQDIKLYAALLGHQPGKDKIQLNIPENRNAWIHIVSGQVHLNERTLLKTGDGVGISKSCSVSLQLADPKAHPQAHFLYFDLN